MTKSLEASKQDLSKAKYIVSFISLMSAETKGYAQAADQMMSAVQSQPGFIAAYSARNEEGVGITNSYWSSLEAIAAWRADGPHQAIQNKGKTVWYQWYQLQVCEIVKNYGSDDL
jgi:heme-degrading monooxygenase HmoA